jgi:hypothetical protein
MVAQILKGIYTMKAKRATIKHNAAAYQKATKKVKSTSANRNIRWPIPQNAKLFGNRVRPPSLPL